MNCNMANCRAELIDISGLCNPADVTDVNIHIGYK
jgi:hypothetical protein